MKKINKDWLVGFVDGEGCFYVTRENSSIKYKLGTTVRLRFCITQHSRDEELLKNIIKFLGCGHYYQRKGSMISEYMVTGFKDIIEKILPFFEKNPIIGSKYKDFT